MRSCGSQLLRILVHGANPCSQTNRLQLVADGDWVVLRNLPCVLHHRVLISAIDPKVCGETTNYHLLRTLKLFMLPLCGTIIDSEFA